MWNWEDQIRTKEEGKQITTKTGSTIIVVPRAYIIHLQGQFDRKEHRIGFATTVESSVKQWVNSIHNYETHPEPLAQFTSHFRISEQLSTGNVYIILTNISSQQIRRTLIQHTLTALNERLNLTPYQTWIHNMNYMTEEKNYKTTTIEDVIIAITTFSPQLQQLHNMPPKNNYPTIAIAYQHTAPHLREEDLPVPQRALQQPKQHLPIYKRRRKTSPTTETTTQELLEAVLQAEELHQLQATNTITQPSSSTMQTNLQEQPKVNVPTTQDSHMTTTTTSSSPIHIPTTSQNNENVSSLEWGQTLQEWKKLLLQHNKLTTSNGSFNILSIKISQTSPIMEIVPENYKNTIPYGHIKTNRKQ